MSELIEVVANIEVKDMDKCVQNGSRSVFALMADNGCFANIYIAFFRFRFLYFSHYG